jgi:hypothetical protein
MPPSPVPPDLSVQGLRVLARFFLVQTWKPLSQGPCAVSGSVALHRCQWEAVAVRPSSAWIGRRMEIPQRRSSHLDETRIMDSSAAFISSPATADGGTE